MAPGPVPDLVLASASPRRADILAMLGLDFQIVPARVREERAPGEPPPRYVERLAREKAQAVAVTRPESLVLGGDTVVVQGDHLLEKPADPEEASRMLEALAGRDHEVHTGMALVSPGGRVTSEVATASVSIRDLSRAEIEAYVRTGEPMDKAGSYGIQGMGAALVSSIAGDYYAVVGLSVQSLVTLLGRVGIRYGYGDLRSIEGY